jgi:hypothetical protein
MAKRKSTQSKSSRLSHFVDHSKVKARDIIPGWPRGRTVTVSFDNTRYLYFDMWPWLDRTSFAMQHQLGIDRVYHQMQQAMVNEWFEKYRTKDDRDIILWVCNELRLSKAYEIFNLELDDKPLYSFTLKLKV